MIVVMQSYATQDEKADVVRRAEAAGYRVHRTEDGDRTVFAVVGDSPEELGEELSCAGGVKNVIATSPPYKLASRQYRRQPTTIQVGAVTIGGPQPVIIAGPCAVESKTQLLETALVVKAAGADMLRGGAFKPRTSPYSFRGLGRDGLKILREVGDETGLPVVTEIMSPADIDDFHDVADVLQVGSRNMQNYPLLDVVGQADKPVLLKRGMMATVDELLLSAEYILARGNERVILCERGIRTFETATRNTPDIAAIPVVKHRSHLPILFDPSHTAGERRYVAPLARAGMAAGADGLIVEVHPRPEEALCDGRQALLPEDFRVLMAEVQRLREWLNPAASATATPGGAG